MTESSTWTNSRIPFKMGVKASRATASAAEIVSGPLRSTHVRARWGCLGDRKGVVERVPAVSPDTAVKPIAAGTAAPSAGHDKVGIDVAVVMEEQAMAPIRCAAGKGLKRQLQ